MTDSEPSLDRIFDLLSSRRRRYVLYSLNEADADVVTLEELVDQLETWERKWNDRTDLEPTAHRERLRVALHHNHLPRLADTGLLDYDPRTRTVRRWAEPSLKRWAENDIDELPHLRDLFTTSGT